jgi:hypothetical protein
MTERITNTSLLNALNYYLRACKAVGYTQEELNGAIWGQFYGNVWYIARQPETRSIIHDLPGFVGSTSNGSLTKRDLYNKLQQAAGVMFDLANRSEN